MSTTVKKSAAKTVAKKSKVHRVVRFSGQKGTIPSSEIRRAVEAVASRRSA